MARGSTAAQFQHLGTWSSSQKQGRLAPAYLAGARHWRTCAAHRPGTWEGPSQAVLRLVHPHGSR